MSPATLNRIARLGRGRTGRPAKASWADKLTSRIAGNPANKAISQLKQRAETEFQSQITTVRIRLLSIADGEDAAEVLGIVAVVIGTPMQFMYSTSATAPAWAAQLRGALKTVVQMCLQGYKWQAQYALAIERAVEIAATADVGAINDSNIQQWTQAWLDANYLCAQIQDRKIDGTEVA